jgi:parallel beta-helix repeat protein
MKTLVEVEPRTNLQAPVPPAGVDTASADYHFIINQPGSYYLSANLAVTKPNGIRINAEGVTLDLNGFQVSRASGTGGAGINLQAVAQRCVVKNGSVTGFGDGVGAGGSPQGVTFLHLTVSACSGLGFRAGDSARIESCAALDNGSSGFFIGAYSVVKDCIATRNASEGFTIFASSLTNSRAYLNGGTGVIAGGSCVLTGVSAGGNQRGGIEAGGRGSSLTACTATNNAGAYGIYAEAESSLVHCVARANTNGSNVNSYGIYVEQSSTVLSCTSDSNTSTFAGTPSGLNGNGIFAGAGSRVQDCTVTGNKGDGIRATSNVTVSGNNCYANGASSGSGAGIRVSGGNNRIEGNTASGNDRGIEVTAPGNLILRNSAADNTTNYEIAADNRYGAIVDLTAAGSAAVSGNGATATTVSTNPWANFAY